MKSSIRMLLEILQEERMKVADLEDKVAYQKGVITRLETEKSFLVNQNEDLRTKDRVQNPDPSATLVRELLGSRHISGPEDNLIRIRKVIRALTNPDDTSFDWRAVSASMSPSPFNHCWSDDPSEPDYVKIIL